MPLSPGAAVTLPEPGQLMCIRAVTGRNLAEIGDRRLLCIQRSFLQRGMGRTVGSHVVPSRNPRKPLAKYVTPAEAKPLRNMNSSTATVTRKTVSRLTLALPKEITERKFVEREPESDREWLRMRQLSKGGRNLLGTRTVYNIRSRTSLQFYSAGPSPPPPSGNTVRLPEYDSADSGSGVGNSAVGKRRMAAATTINDNSSNKIAARVETRRKRREVLIIPLPEAQPEEVDLLM